MLHTSTFTIIRPNVIFKGIDRDDTLKAILTELGGVPNLDSEELKDARDTQITLELTNRFAHVQGMLAIPQRLLINIMRRSPLRRENPMGPSEAWSSRNPTCSAL